MASLEGISIESATKQLSRTLLSSVGGFSQPSRRHIRSLQDLVGTIRLLGLEFFPGYDIQEQSFLGEGISYKVFRCLQRQSKKVIAVKQVKLPLTSSIESFERQVACVLRDIEASAILWPPVMSHELLAKHENVLNILGYGWNFRGSGSIPFLVTEYAPDGTLRNYLKEYHPDGRDKILLCMNVANGLHELHLCGLAHGDLKLDNVLVTLKSDPEGPIPEEKIPGESAAMSVVAKISDFGHSLLLYDEGDKGEEQRYGGTLAYNAPELSRHFNVQWDSINFRKCDIWALGLLCWEALDNGSSYYKSLMMQELIAFSRTDSGSTTSTSASAGKSSTESVVERLFLIADRLLDVAIRFLDSDTVKDLSPYERLRLKELFRQTLNENPDGRVADIPMTPMDRSILAKNANKLAEWSFEMFRPAQIALIPHPVKTQIFADCRRLGSETGRSLSSARAAFQVGLAYLAGFGVEKDYLQSLDWVTKSVSKGLRIASSFHDLISESFGDHRAENSASRHDRYTHFIRSGFKASTVQYLDVVSGSPPTTYLELKALATDQQFETGLPFYIAHHAVVYGFTHLLHREDGINLQEESSGETALFLACRLGNFQALNNLLSLGADPSIVAFDGCLPIHWLFMFQPECIETAADRLTLGMGVSPQLSASTVHPRYLDPQVPLRLLGTPLAFAVAVASKRAVEVLLQKGADPSIGDPRMKADSRNPIDLAISLHLSDILGLLLEGLEAENRRSLTREWPYLLVECSPTERKLLHGNLSRIALQETIGLVQGEPILGLHGLTITELAESAIRVADLEVASAIIPIETSSKLSRTDRNELMLSCTKSACRGGYEMTTCVDLLEFARSRGARLDCDLDGHWTQRAINIAVEFHQGEILDWFINNGANPNARDPEGRSLLHHMISSGFSSAYPLSRLLKAGANPNLQETTSGNTPLHTAAQEGKLDETATLLEFKADAGIAGESQSMSSALHCAGRSGNPQVVSAIIRYDRRLNLTDAFGRTPLFAAAAGGSAEVVRVLIDAGADCAARDREGISCLHLAAMGQHHQVLELLLGRVGTSDVNSVIPRSGESALHLAIKASKGTNDPSISCCALLLNAGADPNLTNNCGEPAVAVAAQEFSKARNRHRRQLLEMMVKMGADISNCTRTGTSMLHQAVASLDTELVRELIVLGASVNVIDRDGQTPLHKCPLVGPAASTSRPRKSSQSVCELTQSLVDAGADIRSLDNSGFTPLELAVIADNGPMVSTLLDYHKVRSGPSQQYNEATGGSSGEQLQTGQAGGSPEHPSDLIEQWASASAVRTKHGKPHTFEHRYEGINILHRQIVKTAWNRAISIQHWASACAFIHKRLHGDTEPLKWPVGLHLFKYALEEDLGPVLAEFMGHYSALCTPDPVLEKVWTVLRTQSLKQSASELRWTVGDRRVHRAMQLVRRNDYTPLLDLPSLTERGYIEAQSERGLIQALFVNKEESVPNFRVITAFVPYEDQVDREIQEQFNSLLRPMADTYRQQSTGGAATRT